MSTSGSLVEISSSSGPRMLRPLAAVKPMRSRPERPDAIRRAVNRSTLGERQQAPGLVEEGHAGVRQLNLPVVAFEEFRTDAPLQFLDLAAQRRLGHVQALRRAAEVEFLRDGDETGQLVKGKHDAFLVSLRCIFGLRHAS